MDSSNQKSNSMLFSKFPLNSMLFEHFRSNSMSFQRIFVKCPNSMRFHVFHVFHVSVGTLGLFDAMTSTTVDITGRLSNNLTHKMSDHAIFYIKIKIPSNNTIKKSQETSWVFNDEGFKSFKVLATSNQRLSASWCGTADINTMYAMWEKSIISDFRASFNKRRISHKPT